MTTHCINNSLQRACLAACLAGLLAAPAAFAQTTIAKWTFENLAAPTIPVNPGAGNWITNIAPEVGSGTASGKHAGPSIYNTVTGNGSAKAFTSTNWTTGDFYQFVVSTIGFQSIVVSCDQLSSGTGPGRFNLAYSTDGIAFTTYGDIYSVTSAPAWSTTTPSAPATRTFDLGAVPAVNNAPVVYFRVVVANTTSASGATIGTGGTSRVDNFGVTGTVPGRPNITSDLSNTNVPYGSSLTLGIVATGTAPLTYQWYYPNLSTPLLDATNASLVFNYISTNDAGNYRVIVANGLGSATSAVATVTVTVVPPVVTNIAYVHKLQNANYVLTNTTTLFQVEGVVTTPANLVSGSTPVYSFYIQDATGGIDVFHRGGFSPELPAVGDKVRITAPLLQFNGLLEMAPVSANPTHKIEVIESGLPLPEPRLFTFDQIIPSLMETNFEGSYVVASNVFLSLTNGNGPLIAGSTVYMTNLNGKVFTMLAPAAVLDPQGMTIPAFASSVRGVMSQNTGSAVPTNGYSILLTLASDIVPGTPPPAVEPLLFSVQGNTLLLNWTSDQFVLASSTNVAGPYVPIPGATKPYAAPLTGKVNFFRLVWP